jgi:hypothetical protein
MKVRGLSCITLVVALAACSEEPSPTGATTDTPRFAKATSDPGIAETFDEAAGKKIISDGRAATILGVLTPASYADGQCGVKGKLNLTDAVMTLKTSLTKTEKASCADRLGTGRLIKFTLDSPVNAGDPTFETASVPYHMKFHSVQAITASGYVNGGWGRIGSTDPRVGDCEKIRFSTEYGADPVLVTRTKTKDVNGSDRNEWTVETVGTADRAACLDADLNVLRYYHLPFKITITQITY